MAALSFSKSLLSPIREARANRVMMAPMYSLRDPTPRLTRSHTPMSIPTTPEAMRDATFLHSTWRRASMRIAAPRTREERVMSGMTVLGDRNSIRKGTATRAKPNPQSPFTRLAMKRMEPMRISVVGSNRGIAFASLRLYYESDVIHSFESLGIHMANVDPSPSLDSAVIVPPWASTALLQ